jgi:plasmid stability protein
MCLDEDVVASLTVRNLDDDVVRALRIRAVEHGRSAEAEHREKILTVSRGPSPRAAAAERLAEFRRRAEGSGSAPTAQPLEESRVARTEDLIGGSGAR